MYQRSNVVPLKGPSNSADYLATYGFLSPRWVHRDLVLVSAVPVLALLFGTLVHGRYEGIEVKVTDVALAVAGLGALLVGYQQWRNARHEISLDKYYERLEIANRRQDGDHKEVQELMRSSTPELTGESSQVMFYIYAELDNLEYVIEKYRLGFMSPGHACRGLRTFQLRCWSKPFRQIVRHRVHAGDYNPLTAEVVECVCRKIEDHVACEYQSASKTDRRKTPPGPASPRRRSSDFPRPAPPLEGGGPDQTAGGAS